MLRSAWPVLMGLLLAVGPSEAAVLVNAGFEAGEPTGGGFPQEFGDWAGDASQIVPAQDDIEPFTGSRMLQFLSSTAEGPDPDATSAETVQLIDVSGLRDEIDEGRVTARAASYFNRVAGDLATDSEFLIELFAYDGSPSTIPARWRVGALDGAVSEPLISDSDRFSWEVARVSLDLPMGTEFVALVISAEENVSNDGIGFVEYDGHYADGVSFSVRIARFIPGDVNDDGAFDVTDAVVLRRALLDPDLRPGITQQNPSELPASGQTTAYAPGDDGDIQAGEPLTYTDNGDGTVTVNSTGLMWEKKTDDGDLLHDRDNLHVWDLQLEDSIWDWLERVNAEDDGGFAGYDDWRIPSVKELQSIIDYEEGTPAVHPRFHANCTPGCSTDPNSPDLSCSCTANTGYWSSSTVSGIPTDAWIVNFRFGSTVADGKDTLLSVRAVRDSP